MIVGIRANEKADGNLIQRGAGTVQQKGKRVRGRWEGKAKKAKKAKKAQKAKG